MADAAGGQTAWVRLPEDEARARLESVPVVRLATAGADGRPHLVVATFATEFGAGDPGAGVPGSGDGASAAGGDRIYTAVDQKPKESRSLKRLRNILENPRVAVLADHYEDDWDRLWWVRADGHATVTADPAEMAGPIALLARRYPQYRRNPPDGPVIAIRVDRWTGWAFR
jgi:PPOX class probable F420-dependent enzyme